MLTCKLLPANCYQKQFTSNYSNSYKYDFISRFNMGVCTSYILLKKLVNFQNLIHVIFLVGLTSKIVV